jgi:excisionase family DNA binding protein
MDMVNEYYTVEQISEMLSIHPKTIQRYIREGKLRASKIGKSWRVTGHDLSVFTESTKNTEMLGGCSRTIPIEERVKVSSVVDISIYDRDEAIRIMNTMTAVSNSKPPEYGSSSVHAQYIETENKVRITLWGTLSFMEAMIGSLSVLTEQSY